VCLPSSFLPSLIAGDKMQFAQRVGLDLYRFLEGFATQASGDAILIPTSALDRCALVLCTQLSTGCLWAAHIRQPMPTAVVARTGGTYSDCH
jgi:hypothetical protein